MRHLFFFICQLNLLYADSVLHMKNLQQKMTHFAAWQHDTLVNRPGKEAIGALYQLKQRAVVENNKENQAVVSLFLGGYQMDQEGKIDSALIELNAALAIGKTVDNLPIQANAYRLLGRAYLLQHNLSQSFSCQLNSYELSNEYGKENVYGFDLNGYELVLLYYKVGDFEQALHYLKDLELHFSKIRPYLQPHILNTIALCYGKLGNDAQAAVYFNKTLEYAKARKDDDWTAIASGNIADLLIKRSDFQNARALIDTEFVYATRVHDCSLIAESQILLAKIQVSANRPDSALANIAAAINNMSVGDYEGYLRLSSIYKIQQNAYALKGDYRQAFHFAQLLQNISDSLDQKDKRAQYNNIKIGRENEKHIAKVQLLETERQHAVQRRNGIILILGLLALSGFLIIYSQRLRSQKKEAKAQKIQQQLSAETKLKEVELVGAQRELSSYIENLKEKNRLIDRFTEELDRLNHEQGQPKNENEPLVDQLLQSVILTEDDWDEFKTLFTKIHTGFFTRLKLSFPDLTQSEIRLLALTRLNLSTKEMAAMLGISPASVRTGRFRLRKKLNLEEENDLISFVATV